MSDPDKTNIYSDGNKTTSYGDSVKLTKESVHHLKVGDDISLNNKDYKILEIVSESTGEAVIYKIEDKNQKIYALKLYYEFVDSENEPNHEALARIQKISDVDILKLYDFGTGINKFQGKYCFEISDFAYGHDLLCVEDIKKKYTPEFIEKEVIPQVFLGIIKLHENRIYHCDLKPQNIFYLDKEQTEIVIGDYGSAKTFDFDAEKQSRKTTTVKGSDFYLPPEQARGFISEKNDFFSLGMILLHLFYPETILANENDPKSLSHAKLKQIIERQFESLPIIDFNPEYQRINQLIEGLTLVDFNLRWGKEEIEKWLQGEDIEVVYNRSVQAPKVDQESTSKALKFGTYIINTPNDLRDYILNDKNWYQDLVEDKDNWNDFIEWMLGLYDGDKRKRSAINRIVKDYSQDGMEFIAEAIIRFFIPKHPIMFGLETINASDITHLRTFTAHFFVKLINELWKTSSEKDIKLYLFRYEFALRQQKYIQKELLHQFKILYQALNVRTKIEPDFYDYKVKAYKYVDKRSLPEIKQFLFRYFPSECTISFFQFIEEGKLVYGLKKSLHHFFQKIGIETFNIEDTINENIAIKYPKEYNSLNDFSEKTLDKLIDNIRQLHHVKLNELDEKSLHLFKQSFREAFNHSWEELEANYKILDNQLSSAAKSHYSIKSNFGELSAIVKKGKYDQVTKANNLISKIKEKEKRRQEERKEEIEKEQEQKRERRRTRRGNLWYLFPVGGYFLFMLIFWGPSLLDHLKSKINYDDINDRETALNQVEMVKVEGGAYKMGDKDGPDDEKPVHTVILSDFHLSKCEITNEQFCHFLNLYGSSIVKEGEFKGEKMFYDCRYEDPDWGIQYKKSHYRPKAGYENCPAVYVTWYGANEYCKWAGGRLPTEAEWNYAAIGGNKSKGYKYSGSNNIDDVAWYKNNSKVKIQEVGQKKPNELGIYDMSGNVYEWCLDVYAPDYYKTSPKNNPLNNDDLNNKTNLERVLRGGSYYNSEGSSLPCNRYADSPSVHYANFGFRFCRGIDVQIDKSNKSSETIEKSKTKKEAKRNNIIEEYKIKREEQGTTRTEE